MDVIAVDDDHAGLELLRMVLEAAGHTVRTSRTADGAFDLVTEAAPAVLVTDLMMGSDRQDGFRLIDRLRASPQLAHVPVVALTGVTSAQDLGRARTAGADVCLVKPIDVAAFLQIIARFSPAAGAGQGTD
ncbi:response regulator [Pseudonocardia sp. T1-2H]|uniref:response regulator n=1 Tax=Pseudonocardia sp. T1-2H TaxID=3128899 RepID=UPI003100AA2B